MIDGEHVWIYTPSTVPGQVIRMAVPSGGPVYGYNILSWLLDRPAERYDVKYLRKDTLSGKELDVVELTPTVVGDDDSRGSVLDGQVRILGGQNALDQDRQPGGGS